MKVLRTREPHDFVGVRANAGPTSSPLIRPVALRIDRSAEEFYSETQAEGIPHTVVHAALAESHQWKRNWTTDLPTESSVPPFSPDDVFISSREAGARNPSPKSHDFDRKRSRTGRISDGMAHLVENDEPAISNLSTSPEYEEEEEPVLFRPMALRIGKRSSPCVPKVIQDLPDFARPISPMTHYSSTSSSLSEASSKSSKFSGQICTTPSTLLQQAREGVLRSVAISAGETDSEEFVSNLEILQDHFLNNQNDDSARTEGMWLTLTKPSFFGCLGGNDAGDPMYTLSRMSFDMFSPGALVCSLQGNFNEVELLVPLSMNDHVPASLRDEVHSDSTVIRTYNIITAFTVEPSLALFPESPNKDVRAPIHAIMTTYGYMIDDPSVPHRRSVWITGGKVEPNGTPKDQLAWKELFAKHPPKHNLGAKAKLLAVKWLMGAVIPDSIDPDTGAMEYEFTKPLGGHGFAYIDTLYSDDSLRIVRGHRGTVFVFTRVSGS